MGYSVSLDEFVTAAVISSYQGLFGCLGMCQIADTFAVHFLLFSIFNLMNLLQINF
jgi:hypothetical protein